MNRTKIEQAVLNEIHNLTLKQVEVTLIFYVLKMY